MPVKSKEMSSSKAEQKLTKYRQKRDFTKTAEPAGAGRSEEGRSFVIQKHWATRLHWDLRLEMGGTLASWAVPKEPPAKPGVKRLAIHVEDHPLEYGKFEGTIPKGEYGAGKVEIWDKGWYEPDSDPEKGVRDGKLEFVLHGEKLSGRYMLVRLKELEGDKEQWLFFRNANQKGAAEDEPMEVDPGTLKGAKPGETPTFLKPMLCVAKDSPPKGEDWLREIKWDGYRVICSMRNGKVTIKSRNGNTFSLPEIEKAFEEEDIGDGLFDGELVMVDERGLTSFRLIHQAMAEKRTKELFLYLFDLPFYGGYDLRGCNLEDRKDLLQRVVEQIGSDRIRFSAHLKGEADELYARVCETGLEGLVSKKRNSGYTSARSPSWVKTRCENQVEATIGGFMKLTGDQESVGALLLGIKDDEGRLQYIGRAGTGFTEALRHELYEQLIPLRLDQAPFADTKEIVKKGVVWVEPVHTAKIQYLEWAEGSVLRQPKLVQVGESLRTKPNASKKTAPSELSVKITNPDRVIDPACGATKGEVAAFYHEVAQWLVPQLAGRPLPVIRCPSGLTADCFFHKHHFKGLNESVGKVRLVEDDGEEKDYMRIDDIEGLLTLVQFGVIEFHPWGSLVKHLEQPDILIFDLDPGEDLAWEDVVASAHEIRGHLESLGLRSFAKLSGGKGVHAVVPIKPELEWDEAKRFCEQFARMLAKHFPDKYTAELSKAKRKGRIFVDYLRNGRGATAVSAYSLRARPNLPIAMPVEWDEVSADLKPNAFHIRNALEHLEGRAADPWKDFFKVKQSLKKALGM